VTVASIGEDKIPRPTSQGLALQHVYSVRYFQQYPNSGRYQYEPEHAPDAHAERKKETIVFQALITNPTALLFS